MLPKILILTFVIISAKSMHIRKYQHPLFLTNDPGNIMEIDLEDRLSELPEESVHPGYLKRIARQIHGVGNTNPDGSMNLMGKVPLAEGDQNKLSAIGSVHGMKNGAYGAAGGGLVLENDKGHALSLTGTHIPSFGDQLTAAGKLNLVNTPDHNLNANAFITQNRPNIPNVPNFNTKGAGLDYMFKDKIGGSLGVAHTDFLQKTDYSAMGKLNLFKDPTSSLDLSAGASRSFSPFIPHSSWQPSAGLTYSKYF